jgi:hypothetical protein
LAGAAGIPAATVAATGIITRALVASFPEHCLVAVLSLADVGDPRHDAQPPFQLAVAALSSEAGQVSVDLKDRGESEHRAEVAGSGSAGGVGRGDSRTATLSYRVTTEAPPLTA